MEQDIRKRIEVIKENVEKNSKVIDDTVIEIIYPFSHKLDTYVQFISQCLADGQNPPTDEELDDFIMNLSTYIYFAGTMVEQLGIRDDIAKSVYREHYNTYRANIDKGTVTDKDSLAELASQDQQLVSSIYTRAYKTLKSKVDNAQELLNSCKKVMSRRMQEYNLSAQIS